MKDRQCWFNYFSQSFSQLINSITLRLHYCTNMKIVIIQVIPQFCIVHPVLRIKTAYSEELGRARTPRTRYCFWIHGSGREFRSSFALERARCPIFLRNFCVQFILHKIEEMKKFFQRNKEIKLKACSEPVTQGCKWWPWKKQLEERFESMLFKFAWFSHKL